MSEIDRFDDLDTKIVDQLIQNGRLSPAEIAKAIGDVSERTVRSRITSLIERRLVFVGAIADPHAMGNQVLADLLIDVEPGRTMEVADRLVDYPELSYVGCTAGIHDITAGLAVATNEALLDFVDDLGRIPGVRKVIVATVLTMLKTYGFKTRAADELRQRLRDRKDAKNPRAKESTAHD